MKYLGVPTDTKPTLGQRIAQARKAAGLSQAALARLIGLSRPGLSLIETRARQNPQAWYVAKIAQACGVTVAWLCGEEEAGP